MATVSAAFHDSDDDQVSTTSSESEDEEVSTYTFFNSKLRDNSYATGDIYDKKTIKGFQKEWKINDGGPYLKHVKSLSKTWPHLRLLADFMEVGTTPIRWPGFKERKAKSELEKDEVERECRDRAKKTNVTRLDYLDTGEVVPKEYTTSDALRASLKNEPLEKDSDKRQLRLFIVEDLSRDVIELLGGHFNIEPAFFREHIVDYAWYNTRDRWVDPPALKMVNKQNRWVPLRFVTARYFKKTSHFQKGVKEVESFNVLRRSDDDCNNNNFSVWDHEGAIVGITRTKASFWLSSTDSQKKGTVGVLLLDPTIKKGVPLWYGYRNWEATSLIGEKIPNGPPRKSLYKDLVYWAQRPEAFKKAHADNSIPNVHVPIQALLHIVCAEWLMTAEYIKTRLNQIEWEFTFPEHFLGKHSEIYVTLQKLHIWRRLVPLYREMLTDTLQRVFNFPCHTLNMTGKESGSSSKTGNGPISVFSDDFTRALSYMEEYQQSIDRLTAVVTAIISIGDSRRAQDDNRNVARLTWLATFFIPLSFVSSLFSMQADLSQLRDTYKLYFEIALPLAAGSIGIAFILGFSSVRIFGTQLAKDFRGYGESLRKNRAVRKRKNTKKDRRTLSNQQHV